MPELFLTAQKTNTSRAEPVLEVANLTKSWGATRALTRVGFGLSTGEVLAIVGENGAGKSTLLGILSGVTQPDEGEIRLYGKAARFASPHAARQSGIGTVFQELSLARNLNVMENIFAGRLPSRFGFIDRAALRRKTNALFASLGLAIDPDAIVGDLPVSSQQIVEIAKAVSLDARVLLLDEPTSALNADEKAALFRVVHALKASGTAIIYISHHLEEVLDLSDRILVLRDGSGVALVDRADVMVEDLVRAMTGRAIGAVDASRRAPEKDVLLETSALGNGTDVHDVSFALRRGEIVALAGLMGSGRSALAEMIAGLQPAISGEIRLKGTVVAPRGMTAAKRLGIGYIPPERKTQGLFLDMPVAANVSAATLWRSSRLGLHDGSRVAVVAEGYVTRLAIKSDGVDVHCRALSGGNQQKVLLAKWLEVGPSLLVVEEPTKGVDVGAKQDIHRELLALAASGTGILMVSSDLPEILSLAHRVLVMHQGRIVADLDCLEASEHEIVALASGLETPHGQ
jgi:ABC-type sugar transport system ATPase subunit